MLPLWNEKKEQLVKGEISEEEYISWHNMYSLPYAEECYNSLRVKRREKR